MHKPGNLKSHSLSSDNSRYNKILLTSLFIVVLTLVVSINSRANTGIESYESYRLRATLNSQGLVHNIQQQELLFEQAKSAFEKNNMHLAYRIFRPLAEDGYVDAQFYLGMMYDAGIAVKRSPQKAVYWYQQSAQKGNDSAQHNLAVAYANGDGINLNIDKAIQWWKQSAKYGNTDAQYNLGIVYATGRQTVQPDLVKAEKWWRKAAINGDAQAQYNLGVLYASGVKKVTSLCEAVRWWQQSARLGIHEALEAIEIIKQRPDYKPC